MGYADPREWPNIVVLFLGGAIIGRATEQAARMSENDCLVRLAEDPFGTAVSCEVYNRERPIPENVHERDGWFLKNIVGNFKGHVLGQWKVTNDRRRGLGLRANGTSVPLL